jgi:hypothetical protein
MENTSQPMDANVVDLGDDISSASPAPGFGGSEIARGVLLYLRSLLLMLTLRVVHMKKKQRAKTSLE